MSRIPYLAPVAAATLLAALPASAHMAVEPAQAAANTTIAVGFRVGHGCGTSPTTALKVRIPDGVTNARPQPKAGWTLTVVRGGPATPAAAADEAALPAVTEVHWTGGTLPNEFYDTFFIRMRLPNRPETTLYFPVVQECQGGVHRWIDVPQPGQPEPAEPTPGLRLTP
ncbi:MAG: YcnI family protein [Alphaproteobacteria bacterium]|nr:YcnI family protein [Alphaproteobacteria bacterium]MBM4438646.1 YcnI family protein [Actinomycetota bacterium]